MLIAFYRFRASWSMSNWRRVNFIDGSRFSVSAHDPHIRVERQLGLQNNLAFVVEHHTDILCNFIVWAGICWKPRSLSVLYLASMMARNYMGAILTTVVLPMLSSCPKTIYLQGNAHSHTVWFAQRCHWCDVLS